MVLQFLGNVTVYEQDVFVISVNFDKKDFVVVVVVDIGNSKNHQAEMKHTFYEIERMS